MLCFGCAARQRGAQFPRGARVGADLHGADGARHRLPRSQPRRQLRLPALRHLLRAQVHSDPYKVFHLHKMRHKTHVLSTY